MNARDEAALAELLDRAAAIRRECRRLLRALALNRRRLAEIGLGPAGFSPERLAVERKPR